MEILNESQVFADISALGQYTVENTSDKEMSAWFLNCQE